MDAIILAAIREYIGSQDITTDATIPQSQVLHGEFLAKSSGIVSGLNVAEKVFKILNKNIQFH